MALAFLHIPEAKLRDGCFCAYGTMDLLVWIARELILEVLHSTGKLVYPHKTQTL